MLVPRLQKSHPTRQQAVSRMMEVGTMTISIYSDFDPLITTMLLVATNLRPLFRCFQQIRCQKNIILISRLL